MGVSSDEIAALRRAVVSEWRENLSPFWLKYSPDEKYGGFRGWITNDLRIDENAEKGIILNSRILWTFSRALRQYGDQEYRRIARRAFEYITGHFVDREHGGVYWTLDC